jgi:hypothetical protein
LEEDMIAVVDGRPALVDEIEHAELDLRDYLRDGIGELLDDAAFLEALAGHLPGDAESQRRLPTLIDRMKRIAGR